MATRQFKVHQVIKACDLFDKETALCIERKREDLIKEHTVYRPWFGFGAPRTRTRDETIHYLKNKSNGNFETLWTEVDDFYYQRTRIRDIRHAAEARFGSDYMTLDTKEIYTLSRWLEKTGILE